MHVRPRLAPGIWLAAFGAAHAADTPPPTLAQALPGVRYTLTLQDGHVAGSAAPVLAQAVAAARYVMIGEEHFTREVPRLAAALCDQMAGEGLSAFAVEAGPVAAQFARRTLAGTDGSEALRRHVDRYPDSIAFLNGREESALLQHCAAAVAPRPLAIWGLDQEFLGAAGWLFEQMLATDPGPAATAALTAVLGEEARAQDKARASGDPSGLWLLAAGESQVAELGRQVRRDGNAQTQRLFEELATSREIYRKNSQGAPESNRQRALLLKRHLAAELAAAGPDPHSKVLFKFGAYHAFKGYNPLGQLDLGNQVAERADAEGASSLHIAVLGAGGVHGGYGGYGRPLQPVPVEAPASDPDAAWLKPFAAAAGKEGWTLFDLRGLRHRHLREMDKPVARLIDGYDLLVLVPEFTAAAVLTTSH